MNLAVITARGGSKRIPRKNIKEFAGNPMIFYAINAAKKSGIFDEIMVSTEDDEIANIARNLGAKVPFMRSKKNADDFATTSDVLIEVCEKYLLLGMEISNVCCIYPCVPLLEFTTLKLAYENFLKSNADMLIPVVRYSFPPQRAFKISGEFLAYNEPQNAMKRSQDLEPLYHDAGMFYFFKLGKFGSDKKIPFILSEENVQDIDNESDWKLAEIKYKILRENSVNSL